MAEKVVIIGAGGHGKVVADIALRSGAQVLGFLDDSRAGEQVCGIPVLGKTEDYVNYKEAAFVLAVGNAAVRRRLAERMAGVRWYTAVHPAACVSPLEVTVGEGSVVMANAVVNPGAVIGSHCIINTAAVVEHDCAVGDFAHISVGAKLGGTVTVGENTWVGIGAAVKNNVSICPDCMIGAGAVAVKDITRPGTYMGVPAREAK